MTLHVHEFGPADGRPVVFLHGLTGHGGRWRLLAERELADFRVVAPDLRGHGDSTRLPPWTLEQHAADVIDLLDALELDRVPLVGHSYGGATALHVTTRAPERVERLALLDPSTGLSPLRCQEVAEEELEPEFWPDLDAARAEFAEMWPAEGVDLEVPANFVQTPDGRWRRRYSTVMAVTAWSEMARRPMLPPRGTRTLLLPATKADFVSPELVAALQDRLGDDLTVREVDSGHVLYLERPAEVGALLREFLCEA
ncbi:alpha/beta fold hydrolase [Kutzneria kofuensis]|uniref:Lipase n=1 Tax=Kutzneria kofuensis TaxID=103725 RepID=A0A7W9NGW6_9PSEU|nr:alpha/beta hydrolase [Kutzneria kofuensis]MBB5891591.1 lipase [Kutzneria kofuensis]